MFETKLNDAATAKGCLASPKARVSTLSGWFERKVKSFMRAEPSRPCRRYN